MSQTTSEKKAEVMRRFEAAISSLKEQALQFPWEDRDVYAAWLMQSYYLVRHTPRFLGMSIGAVKSDVKLKAFVRHLVEERGHDEMAHADVVALGHDPAQYAEYLETATIYQAQYYWLTQFGPIAHQGYSLLLEGLAAEAGEQILERVIKSHGKAASHFLRTHAFEDKNHFAKGIAILCEATPEEIDAAMANLRQGVELYQGMIRRVLAETKTKGRKGHAA